MAYNCVLVSVLSLALGPVALWPRTAAVTTSAAGQTASRGVNRAVAKGTALSERIRRVEQGLLLPVTIKGQAPVAMRLADRMRFYNVPALSIAVITDSTVEWARAYGVTEAGTAEPVHPETIFQAASLSKPLVALATLRLVERGKLSLDEDVNQKLLSWKIPENEFTREKKVTVRHLLSHSAGVTNSAVGTYTIEQALPTLLESLDGKPPARPRPVRVDFVPGSRWRYSGGGYSVLQQLLIDVTEKPFPEVMDELVLKPLQMTRSVYQQPLSATLAKTAASGHRYDGAKLQGRWMVLPELAAGGLWSTPSDMARFVIAVQKAYAGTSTGRLSPRLAKQMLTTQIASRGLGVTVSGQGRSVHFSHGGSNPGYRCLMIGYAQTGQGVVVMTNSDTGSDLIQEVVRAVAREYGWADYQQVERETVTMDPKRYQKYVGVYEYLPGRTITISTEGGRIFAQESREFRGEIVPESDTTFFSLLYNTSFRFVLDAEGNAVEIIARWVGDDNDYKAKKRL